ncbi:MAG: hypothetical protein K8L99_31340, partial [Anaerolineae bacterium]|nr:hypothetical protein [Anaerolineae bacterium]
EYTLMHIFNGAATSRPVKGHPDGYKPDVLLEPDLIFDRSQWATKEDVETYWRSNWTAFRGMWANKRLAEIAPERKPIPLAVLECPWDDTPHLHNWKDEATGKVRNIYQEVIDHYKVTPAPYDSFRGVMTLRKLYEKMMPEYVVKHGDSWFERLLYDQIEWLNEVAPDYYQGFAWFMLDPGDKDWDVKYGCSYHTLTMLLDTLATSSEMDPLPQPNPTPGANDTRWQAYTAIASGGSVSNVRAEPKVASAKVGAIPTMAVKVQHIPFYALTEAEQDYATQPDGSWRVVKLADGKSAGYAATWSHWNRVVLSTRTRSSS